MNGRLTKRLIGKPLDRRGPASRRLRMRIAELEAYTSGFAKGVSERIDELESRVKLLEEEMDKKRE